MTSDRLQTVTKSVTKDALYFVVLQGNCFEPERGLPYAPLLDLLHTYLSRRSSSEITRELGPSAPDLIRLLPELASHLPELPSVSTLEPELAKHRLFNALEGFFFTLAVERPVLISIEDMHWSDETSLDFLLHLARRVASASPLTVDKPRPILLLLICRSEDGNPSLARFLVGLDRARLAHEILLAPLSRDGVEAMLRSIFEQERPISPEFLDAVYDLAEGNPYSNNLGHQQAEQSACLADLALATLAQDHAQPGALARALLSVAVEGYYGPANWTRIWG